MPALDVSGLTASIGGREVVRNVSLSLRSGEKVLLLGPNGAGKTTLLSAIAGLPRVSVESGRVLLDGEDLTGLPAHERARRGVALAYQIPPELTGVTAARLAEQIASRFGTRDLIPVLAEILEVEHLLRRDAFKGFSGGERKRTEVFLTALMRPKFALLDEPDSGVDVDSIKLIARALDFIVSEFSAGLLVVTHTRLLAEQVGASRGMVLMGGRLACEGGALELLSRLEKVGFEGVCGG